MLLIRQLQLVVPVLIRRSWKGNCFPHKETLKEREKERDLKLQAYLGVIRFSLHQRDALLMSRESKMEEFGFSLSHIYSRLGMQSFLSLYIY